MVPANLLVQSTKKVNWRTVLRSSFAATHSKDLVVASYSQPVSLVAPHTALGLRAYSYLVGGPSYDDTKSVVARKAGGG